MKKVLLAISAFVSLTGCSVSIEWDYIGWSEVINETSNQVVLTTVYPREPNSGHIFDVERAIPSGETSIYYQWFDGRVPESIDNSYSASVKLQDGTEIVCISQSDDPWSRYFYDNYESRKKVERGFTYALEHYKREIYIKTYHIDDKLISLWRQAH